MAIQFLRGTKSNLEASSNIFMPGQPVFETDSGQLKIGDGINKYTSLPYVGATSGGSSEFSFTTQTVGRMYTIMTAGHYRRIVMYGALDKVFNVFRPDENPPIVNQLRWDSVVNGIYSLNSSYTNGAAFIIMNYDNLWADCGYTIDHVIASNLISDTGSVFFNTTRVGDGGRLDVSAFFIKTDDRTSPPAVIDIDTYFTIDGFID